MKLSNLLMLAVSSNASRVTMESDVGELTHSDSWKMVSETPADESISALFMFKHQPEKTQKLEEIFWAVSDPQNPRYGEHLTRDQTAELLAPAAGNIDRVTTWLMENGVSGANITFPNVDMVELQTTAAMAEMLFGAKFHTFLHTNTNTALHRVSSYTLPHEVAEVVQIVGGIVRLPEIQMPIIVPNKAESPSVGWPEPCGGKCANKVAPEILAEAYKYSPVKVPAKGNIIATAEFQGQKWSQKEMTKFSAACTPDFPNATVAKEIGGTEGRGIEALLDVEYASAVVGNIPLWNVYSQTYSLENYVKTLAALPDGQIPLINSVS
jgi:tripeptidyl-peptidase-1